MAIGHALVLIQIDWPQEASTLTAIMERILNRGSFSYPLFQTYIICVDILEELTYLWTEHGGGVSLDITTGAGVLQSTFFFDMFIPRADINQNNYNYFRSPYRYSRC